MHHHGVLYIAYLHESIAQQVDQGLLEYSNHSVLSTRSVCDRADDIEGCPDTYRNSPGVKLMMSLVIHRIVYCMDSPSQ